MAQMQISRAVSYNKINVLRCRACVDIAGVTGSIPVAPTTFPGFAGYLIGSNLVVSAPCQQS